MELEYPGAQSPAHPALRMRVPDGWEERPHTTAALFAVDPTSPGGFVVNVLVLVTRVLVGDGLDTLVDTLQSAPSTLALDPMLQGRRRDAIDGNDTVLSALTLTSKKLPFPLFQAQAAILLPGPVSHLVHCYGTCPAALADDYAATFRHIFSSIKFG